MRALKLIDSLVGIILLVAGGGSTFLFLIRWVFIPSEIENASKVDSANSWRLAFQSMFRLAASGMMLNGIMS